MTADLYNKENKKIGTIDLPDFLFGVTWNPDLVNQALTAQLANRRKPVAHTKGRGEVSGGGKKPWRQKHTGRARVGSTRSPLWKGGGVTFGPTNERDFSKKINQSMKRLALRSLLSKKAHDGEVKVIDDFSLSAPKTKIAAEIVARLAGKGVSALLVPSRGHKDVLRAAKNLPKVTIEHAGNLNIYDCTIHKVLVFEKGSIEELAAAKQ